MTALTLKTGSYQSPAVTARSPADNQARSIEALAACGYSVETLTSSTWVDGEFVPAHTHYLNVSGAANHDKALAIITALAAPADMGELAQWLEVCFALTIPREQSETRQDIQIAALGTSLSRYPGDVVRTVLEAWPRQTKWAPVLQELIEKCEAENAPREALIKELTEPRYSRAFWEIKAKEYLEKTDWSDPVIPGPELSNCPMPKDLLGQCRKALEDRRKRVEEYREEVKDIGEFIPKDQSFSFTDEKPESEAERTAKIARKKAAILGKQ